MVLVVEDDPDTLQVTEMVLEGRSCRTVGAENGRRALSVLEVLDPDVIITDMMMPELDGLGFIEEYLKRARKSWASRRALRAEATPEPGVRQTSEVWLAGSRPW